MTKPSEVAGRCACGAVRYRAMGDPLWVANCHCRDCRRVTAAAFATYACYPTASVTITAGAPRVYRSSPGVERRFCGDCGTPLNCVSEHWAGETHLFACTLEDPAALAPVVHVYVAHQLPWVKLADGLPRFRTYPSEGGPESS